MRLLVKFLVSIFLLAVVFVTPIQVEAGSDIFISEIGFMGSTFGGGHDKWVEIFNPTLETIDLSEYSLVVGKSSRRLNLEGQVNSGEAFLVTTNRKNTDSIFNHTSYTSQQFGWNPMSFLSNTTTDMHITLELVRNDLALSNFALGSEFVAQSIGDFGGNKGSIECSIDGACWNSTNEFWEGNFGTPGYANYVILPQPEVVPVTVVEANFPIVVEPELTQITETNQSTQELPITETNEELVPALEAKPTLETEIEIIAETEPLEEVLPIVETAEITKPAVVENIVENELVVQPEVSMTQDSVEPESALTETITEPVNISNSVNVVEIDPIVEQEAKAAIAHDNEVLHSNENPLNAQAELTSTVLDKPVIELPIITEELDQPNLIERSESLAEPGIENVLESVKTYTPSLETVEQVEIAESLSETLLGSEPIETMIESSEESILDSVQVLQTEQVLEIELIDNPVIELVDPLIVNEPSIVIETAATPKVFVSEILNNELIEIPLIEETADEVSKAVEKATATDPTLGINVNSTQTISIALENTQLVEIAESALGAAIENEVLEVPVADTNITSETAFQNQIIERVLAEPIFFEERFLEPIVDEITFSTVAAETSKKELGTPENSFAPAIQILPTEEILLTAVIEAPTEVKSVAESPFSFSVEAVESATIAPSVSVVNLASWEVVDKINEEVKGSQLIEVESTLEVITDTYDLNSFQTKTYISGSAANTNNDFVLNQINPIDYSDLVVLLITALHFEIVRFSKDSIRVNFKKFN